MAYTKQTWLDRVGTFLNRFTKSNETLSSVELVNNPGTITQAGTAFSASRMNYMESGIENAHRIATPLSDLSRVMRINGDGVPMFPDNVAGTLQKYVGFTSSPVYVSGATVIVENGALKLTITTTGNWFAIFPDVTEYNSALLQIEYRATPARPMNLVSGGITWTQIAVQETTGSRQILTGYTDVQNRHLEINNEGWSVGDVVYIYSEYLGSGLYDTPVYGKDGQTVAVNHGAVPVNGPRGNGLLFQGKGAMKLVFNGPVISSTGTIRFKFKTSATLSAGYYFGNYEASAGVNLYQDIAGNADIAGFTIGSLSPDTEYVYSLHVSSTNLYVYRNGTLTHTHTLSAPLVAGTSNLYISRVPLSTDGQDFSLYDFEYVAEAETLDAHIRYHNGDDAVDSQQKSATPVPHSIVTRDANGGINASNMFSYDLVIDSNAKLAAWAKAAHKRLINHAETMARMDGAIEELFRRQHAEHAETVGRLMDFIMRLAERCAGQAEALSRRAEK